MARRLTYRFCDYSAKCDDCGWTATSRNALGLAAQHSDRHQHTVHTQTFGGVTFTPEGSECHGTQPGGNLAR